MIGNTILFKYHSFGIYSDSDDGKELEGIVIDAYTEVSGGVSGSSGSLLGFGSGSVKGKTKSDRIYIVQCWPSWDVEKKHTPRLVNVRSWQVRQIIKLAVVPVTILEKIKPDEN